MSPQAIPSLLPICDLFDAFLIDQYGVVHDGGQAFFAIKNTLKTLKNARKIIIMISNSGQSASQNKNLMEKLSIPTHLFDHIITSGDATLPILSHLSRRFSHTPLCFPLVNHYTDLTPYGVQITDNPSLADIVFLAGIDRYPPSSLPPLLLQFLQNNALMLCANPDMQGITSGGIMRDAPGKIARDYELLGGKVIRVGKPDPAIFSHALSLIPHIPKERTLMIGDSLSHDILGGVNTSIPTLLVASGLHRNDLGLSHFNPFHAPAPSDHKTLASATLALCSHHNTPPPSYVAPLFMV